MTTSVAIIGGGCAGVACATTLIKNGAKVAIFEKKSALGGLAGGYREPHWNSSLEYFYHHWFKSDQFVKEYLNEWGLTENLIFKRPLTVMETKQNGFAQLDSPLSLLAYPELSIVSKFRMALALATVKMKKNWKHLESVTAKQWCESYMGTEGFSELWEPLLKGKFGDEWAERVNMAWFWARLACRTPELGTYKGGFAQLFSDVEKWLETHGASVMKNEANLSVSLNNEQKFVIQSEHSTQVFDKLVVATGAGAFASILGKLAPNYAAGIVKRPSLGAHVVIFSLKKSVSKAYWCNLRKTETRPFLALIEHTNFVPTSEFGGEHIVYLANYLDTSSPAWYQTDAEIVQLATASLQFVNRTITKEDIINARVFRDAYAQPIVGVGASKNIPPMQISEIPNLFHASMAHVYPWDRGTNFAFELGKIIAQQIAM